MSTSRPATFVLAALTLACSGAPEGTRAAPRPPEAASPEAAGPGDAVADVAWSARAGDEALELAQVGVPPAPCALEARRGGRVIWTAARCLARRGQPVFLGPDGETAIAVDRVIPRGDGPDGTGPVVVVTRRGEPVRGFRAGELVPGAQHGFSDLWLAPLEQGPEHAPRLSESGDAVLLETARGAVVALRFDGAGWPGGGAAGPGAPPDPADEVTMYRWEDAAGDVHYTVASEVPRDRARTARRVTAQIGTVAVEPARAFERPRASDGRVAPLVLVAPPRPPGTEPVVFVPAPARAPPPGVAPPRSTFHVDTVNKSLGPPGYGYPGSPVDADAMDRQYEKQKKEMNCREVNGVVICG